MSKRLNKRQQREQEELEQLKAIQQAQIATDSEEEEGDEEDVNKGVDDGGEVVGKAGKGPVNPFDAVCHFYALAGGRYRRCMSCMQHTGTKEHCRAARAHDQD